MICFLYFLFFVLYWRTINQGICTSWKAFPLPIYWQISLGLWSTIFSTVKRASTFKPKWWLTWLRLQTGSLINKLVKGYIKLVMVKADHQGYKKFIKLVKFTPQKGVSSACYTPIISTETQKFRVKLSDQFHSTSGLPKVLVSMVLLIKIPPFSNCSAENLSFASFSVAAYPELRLVRL